MAESWITITGARQNNLKNIDVRIPLNALTVITGVVRLGQVEPRLRRPLRRGPAALRRELLGLHAAVPRPHGQAAGRAHRRHPAGDRHQPGQHRQDLALDGRHDDRAARPPEAAVRQDRRPALPPMRPSRCGATPPTPCGAGLLARARRHARAGRPSTVPLPGRPAVGRGARRLRARRASAACWLDGAVRDVDELSRAPAGDPLTVVADRLVVRRRRDAAASVDSLEQAFRFGKGRAGPASSPTPATAAEPYARRARVPALRASPTASRPPICSRSTARSAPARPAAASAASSTSISTWSSPTRASRSPTARSSRGARKSTEWERGELLTFCRAQGIPTDVPFAELTERAARRRSSTATGKYHRHPRLVPLARGPHLPDARARLPVALPQLPRCARPATAAASSPTRCSTASTAAAIADVQPHERRRGRGLLRRAAPGAARGGGRAPRPRRDPQPPALPARRRPRLPDPRPPVAHAVRRRAGARRPHDARSARRWSTRSTSSTSRRSACTRATASAWCASSTSCAPRRTPSSSSSTTPEIIREADHIIDLGPARASAAGRSCSPAPTRELLARRARSPAEYLAGRRRIADAGASADAPISPTCALAIRGAAREQPARRRRRHSPVALRLRHRRLGLGQVDAGRGRCSIAR